MTRVQVLSEEPIFSSGLDAAEVREAEIRCTAPTERIYEPRWTSRFHGWEQHDVLRVVLDGYGLRRVTAGDFSAVELVGPGCVLAPCLPDQRDDYFMQARTLTEVRVAVLDRRFVQYAARWPEILLNVAAIAADRVGVVSATAALARIRGLDDRIHRILWYVACKWGHVTPLGVRIPFRLGQADLADLVAARRPSVTTSLSQLRADRKVADTEDGHWLVSEPQEASANNCDPSTSICPTGA